MCVCVTVHYFCVRVCVTTALYCTCVQVRTHWKNGRFFYGRNCVLQAALGRTEAEEYKEGLSQLAKVHLHTCIDHTEGSEFSQRS